MFLLKKLLSAWLLPPLGLLLAALLLLVVGKGRRSRVAAVVMVLLTLLLSLPIVADGLSQTLEGLPVSAADLGNAQAIVILGGGVHYGAPEYGDDTLSRTSLERVRYGAKLARESKLPVLVTGGSVYGGRPEGELMKQVLENEFSVPVRWMETQSRDTKENAAYSIPLLRAAGIRRIALVTHAWHMRRSIAAFEQQDLVVIAAPTGFAPEGTSMFERLLPSIGATERSANAIREWVGLAVLR